MQHPAVKLVTENLFIESLKPSCFPIRLCDCREIFTYKLKKKKLGDWVTIGKRICISCCSDLYRVRKWSELFKKKEHMDPKGIIYLYAILPCILTCALDQLLLIARSYHQPRRYFIIYYLLFNECLQWLWLQLPSWLSSSDYKSLCIRVLQNDSHVNVN